MKFNEKLIILRKNMQKSQQEIADFLGVGQSSYSRYENSPTTPDIFMIKKLADLYKISIDELMSEVDDDTMFIKISKEEAEILKNIAERVSKTESIKIDINVDNNNGVIIGNNSKEKNKK